MNSLQKEEQKTGPPDLMSIQSGLKSLKPASARPEQPKPKSTNPMDEIFGLIRKGIKLKSVQEQLPLQELSPDQGRTLSTPSEDHMKLLVESLNRISVFTRESSPESDSESEFDDWLWVCSSWWWMCSQGLGSWGVSHYCLARYLSQMFATLLWQMFEMFFINKSEESNYDVSLWYSCDLNRNSYNDNKNNDNNIKSIAI